jgi:hypothetical protein
MKFPEALYMKNTVNEHCFPLVTHTAYFDTRFGRYRLLKSVKLGYDAELFWIDWTLKMKSWVCGPKMGELGNSCL